MEKKRFRLPTAYTILLLLTVVIALLTHLITDVESVSLGQVLMAPVGGVTGAVDVSLFVLVIGGFLGIVGATGALDAGISALVNKLKGGRELLLIPVLMLVFSLGGTTFGFAEEALAFFALIGVTMIKAGFDPVVSVATIVIGAYAGTLGSTVNPFSVGASIAAAADANVVMNQGTIISVGAALWLGILALAIWYTVKYAGKISKNKANGVMSDSEFKASENALMLGTEKTLEFTGKRKLVIWLFAFTFVIMMLGVIPWPDWGITIFETHTAWLLGSPLGTWWFAELTTWFFLMSIVIGLVYGMKEKQIVSSFVKGASEMVGVAFIIGISRGISILLMESGLGDYILYQLSDVLSGMSGPIFGMMAFIVYIPLTFLIGSTSGLATVSMPIFAPLAASLGMRPEIVVASFTAAAGWLAFFTPTNPILMGGLEISKIEYGTWIKFVGKFSVMAFILILLILSGASLILS